MSGFCWGLSDMGVLEVGRRENRGKRLWGSGVLVVRRGLVDQVRGF